MDRKVGFIGGREQGREGSHATICMGATIRDVFDPTAILGELLFCPHVFRFIHIKLSNSPLLEDVNLLAAR